MKTRSTPFPGEKAKDALVLASASPRRAALLAEAGIPFRAVDPGIGDIEEERLAASWCALGHAPGEVARRLAVAKALAAERKEPSARAILAADTVVLVEGRVLGKPRDRAHASSMILELSGRTHEVLTGFALLDRSTGALGSGVESSRVAFRRVEEAALERFLASGAWAGKAGAYGVQDEEARELVASVEGSRSNVVGLPLERVRELPLVRALAASRGAALAPALLLVFSLFLTGCPGSEAAKNTSSQGPPSTGNHRTELMNVPDRPGSDSAAPDSSVATPDTKSTTSMKKPFVPTTEDGVPQSGLPERKLRVGGKTITVELATTRPMRQVGLMNRDSMEDDHGMLFVYPAAEEDFRSFWMHNTRIPLTVAFLKDDGTIVNTEDMIPETEINHKSHKRVRLALEMNRGWFEVHGVRWGDRVEGLGDVLSLAE